LLDAQSGRIFRGHHFTHLEHGNTVCFERSELDD
jgi:hypothetical protein